MFPDRVINFLEAEELISSIEIGICQMHRADDEFKDAYEQLRRENPESMD